MSEPMFVIRLADKTFEVVEVNESKRRIKTRVVPRFGRVRPATFQEQAYVYEEMAFHYLLYVVKKGKKT